MNLSIDFECCTGCGACAEYCPGHVLAMGSEDRPYEKYPDDCWYCGVCQEECPAGCIRILFPYLVR
jgi:NAD-dependent dihydropyrimidine dehydrogenase PreA subunit